MLLVVRAAFREKFNEPPIYTVPSMQQLLACKAAKPDEPDGLGLYCRTRRWLAAPSASVNFNSCSY
jgi:hypothetical protein